MYALRRAPCQEEQPSEGLVFAWRHKILDVLAKVGDDTVLSGVVEVDEAFFTVSYKGNSRHFDGEAEREPPPFNIQRINSYHSQLRLFVSRFKGVSTKYLNNYLIWNNAVRYCKLYDANKLSLMFEAAASAMLFIRSADIEKRLSLPLLV